MSLGEPLVERHGLLQRIDRLVGPAAAVVGERQLVIHARHPVVELDEGQVLLGRALVAAHRGIHVAQELDRARRGRVERRGLTQIPERRVELAPPAVGVAPLQVREHRLVFEREGAAERLDRAVGLVARQRGVAGDNEPLEFALLADGVPGDEDPGRERGQSDGQHEEALHRRHRSRAAGNLRARAVSNPV